MSYCMVPCNMVPWVYVTNRNIVNVMTQKDHAI